MLLLLTHLGRWRQARRQLAGGPELDSGDTAWDATSVALVR